MKGLFQLISKIPFFGGLIILLFVLFSLSCAVYGLYLAFSASFILGILALIIEPSPFILGFVMFFFEKDLAQAMIDFLSK